LCGIVTEGWEGYLGYSDKLARNGPRRFWAFGSAMRKEGMPEAIKIFKQLSIPIENIKVVFPHASSKTDWDEAAKKLGIKHLLYHIYPRYGNVVTASVPAGIALAIKEGKIERGNTLVGWVGSSGMSFAAYSFIY
jgi:3-oxoacyl-[acyl-carrier-protein] synthase III